MFTLLTQAKLENPLSKKLSPTSTEHGAVLFSDFIRVIVGWLITAGVLIFILFFFINAIKYISAQGDKNSLESARMGLLHALVGLVIVFAIFAVLRLIEVVFGVCTLQIPIPTLGVTTPGCYEKATSGTEVLNQ